MLELRVRKYSNEEEDIQTPELVCTSIELYSKMLEVLKEEEVMLTLIGKPWMMSTVYEDVSMLYLVEIDKLFTSWFDIDTCVLERKVHVEYY